MSEPDALPSRDPDGDDLLGTLASAPPHRRKALALDRLSRHLDAVVGANSDLEVEPDRKLFEVGLTSLNLHDLRARLEAECRTELPIPLFFAHSSLTALSEHLVSMVAERAHAAAAAEPTKAPAPKEAVDELSEEDAEAKLQQRLDDLERRFES